MKRLTLAVVASFALPSFAASPAVCDKFVKAFEKAGKAVGKAPDADGLSFWKGACLKDKETDANITRQTKCLEGVKAAADLNACFK